MQHTLYERFRLWLSEWSGISYETEAMKQANNRKKNGTVQERSAMYARHGMDESQIRIAEWMVSVENGEPPSMTGTLSRQTNSEPVSSVLNNSHEVARLQKELRQWLTGAGLADAKGDPIRAANYRAEASVVESKLRALGA